MGDTAATARALATIMILSLISSIAIDEIRLRIMIVASALAVAAVSPMVMAWARVY